MMNEARVFVSGYVASDPTFTLLGDGRPMTKLRVAWTPRKRDRETGEWSDGQTSFAGVNCWRTLAENVAKSLRKGEPVLVQGKINIRRYENSAGEPRQSVEIDATWLGHDLSRGVAQFARTRRSGGETAFDRARAEGLLGPLEREAAGRPDAARDDERLDETSFGEDDVGDDGLVDEQVVTELAQALSDATSGEEPLAVPA
jgi:single-strand DNA-binding protein